MNGETVASRNSGPVPPTASSNKPAPRSTSATANTGNILNAASTAVANAANGTQNVINNIYNTVAGGGGGSSPSGTGVSASPGAGSIIPSWKTMFSLARR